MISVIRVTTTATFLYRKRQLRRILRCVIAYSMPVILIFTFQLLAHTKHEVLGFIVQTVPTTRHFRIECRARQQAPRITQLQLQLQLCHRHYTHHPYSQIFLSPTSLSTMLLPQSPTFAKPCTELKMTDSSTTSTTAENFEEQKRMSTILRLLLAVRHQISQKHRNVFPVLSTTLHFINRTINQSVILQLLIMIVLYLFHLTILTQNVAILFWHTFAIGYDSLFGAIIFILYYTIQYYYNQQQKLRRCSDGNYYPVESRTTSFPWNLPRPQLQSSNMSIKASGSNGDTANLVTAERTSSFNKKAPTSLSDVIETTDTEYSRRKNIIVPLSNWFTPKRTTIIAVETTPSTSNNDFMWIRFRMSVIIACGALMKAYFQTGRYSLFWEDLLYSMSAAGWPLTIPLSRSIQVLAGHLTWVTAGSVILWAIPRPPPFFQRRHEPSPNINGQYLDKDINTDQLDSGSMKADYQWFRMSLRNCNWVWWTIGGYYVSSWLFNIADTMNRSILPLQVLQDTTESVVSQLVQPEHNDLWASMIGYIAPCITAPVWEELLYRGFLLAGLTSWTGSYQISCVAQAIIFSAHHMSITAAIPLAVLGYTWAVLYTQSKNLWTVIAVHAMWNSRVFFGSWFGL
jgi:membrane protease YdiL (CAAX protease family)